MVTIELVSSKEQLKGIQALQAANLRKNLTEQEAAEQGFLMAEYSLDFYKRCTMQLLQ